MFVTTSHCLLLRIANPCHRTYYLRLEFVISGSAYQSPYSSLKTSWLVIGAAAMKTSDMPWRHFPHCLGKKKCQKKLRDQKPGPLQLRRHPAG
ncbi:uncharacterized protein [Symphalangus syndactylus]|uniref:uncharacterized protein isoform X4 n=1 Tax=Symphalangus syndactylus TaxID=9590 RepID=UPI0030055F97